MGGRNTNSRARRVARSSDYRVRMTWSDDPRRRGSAAVQGSARVRAGRARRRRDAPRAPGRGRILGGGRRRSRAGSTRGGSPTSSATPPCAEPHEAERAWHGPAPAAWETSLDERRTWPESRRSAADIREGDVYQVNLCRVLSAPLPARTAPGPMRSPCPTSCRGQPRPVRGAHRRSRRRRRCPAPGSSPPRPSCTCAWTATPCRRRPSRARRRRACRCSDKDEAENVMITDLIRNDLSHVADARQRRGSRAARRARASGARAPPVHGDARAWRPRSTGRRRMWRALFDGTFPPGSVSGRPQVVRRSTSSRARSRAPRGPYCGAIGWIDADARRAELAVGIRTFWWNDDARGHPAIRHGRGHHVGIRAGGRVGRDASSRRAG